jgi:hypothetical protein
VQHRAQSSDSPLGCGALPPGLDASKVSLKPPNPSPDTRHGAASKFGQLPLSADAGFGNVE